MVHPGAAPLLLRVGDQEELTRLVRASSVRAGVAQRARIVLLASEGLRNAEIAERVGVSRPTVNLWRSRYGEAGMAGLVDLARPGRPRRIDQRRIIAETLTPPPKWLGVTHWSSRLLASRLGVNYGTVAAAWRAFGVRPWKAETFKFSTDPELVAKVTDIIGLVPGAAGERDRLVCGRKVPDPSLGPDPEDAADAAEPSRAAHP
jgi:transposase